MARRSCDPTNLGDRAGQSCRDASTVTYFKNIPAYSRFVYVGLNVLFIAVIAKVVVWTITRVTAGGACLPGARGLVLAQVERAGVGAVGAVVTCK